MLEWILRFSIAHRYVVVLFTLAAAALGADALRLLPIDAVPDITNKQVVINTSVPAMSPEEMEKQVTLPIETDLAGLPGLEYTRSITRSGFSQITVVFADSVDIYTARQQVSEKLAESRQNLPPEAEPAMGAVTTGLSDIYMWVIEFTHPDGKGAAIVDGIPGWQSDGSYLTPEGKRLTSDFERTVFLRTVEDWIVRPQVKQVKDVADVDTQGGYVKQYEVEPDPAKLLAYDLSFRDVFDALEKNNLNAGAGLLDHKGESYIVRATGRIEDVSQIGHIMLAERHGTPVYIRDVATVGLGKEIRSGAASLDGREVVMGVALMLTGANSRTVADAVDTKVHNINLPADVRIDTLLSRKKLVDATIHTVASNLFEGAILVVVVLLILLGSIRAALITALAIPLSMLLMASGMVASKVSGNLMSLGAIDFGLIVDGAVIIVENCLRMLAERQRELGRPLTRCERLETVAQASQQVRGATAFGEAIIIIVYLPILTLTGIEGKMFFPMAFTVVLALVAAFVLSLTFVPAMVAILVRGKVKERENVLIRWAKTAYAPVLHLALRARYAVVALGVALFAGSIVLFTHLGREFIPKLDEQDIDIATSRIPSASLAETQRIQFNIEEALGPKNFPQVQRVGSRTGTGDAAHDAMPAYQADTYVLLKPRSQWPDPKLPKDELIQKMQAALDAVPGSTYEYTQPVEDRFNDLLQGVRTDVAVNVFGEDFKQMIPVANRIKQVLDGVPGAQDVKVAEIQGQPLMDVAVDRVAAARHGLNVSDVQEVVSIAVGGRKAGVVFEGDRRFDIVVRLPEQARRSITDIAALPVPLPRGEVDAAALADAVHPAAAVIPGAAAAKVPFVSLNSVARIRLTDGLNEIARTNGRRRVEVQCNVRGRDLGSFVADAQARIDREIKPTLPPGNEIDWSGQFKNYLAARSRLAVVVPISLVLIFMLLFSTFNSAKYALLVFTGVPLALSGGVAALWLRGMPFSISAAVGFIALSGVAVLNGLVMVTFINQLRAEGATLDGAIMRGCLTRLRPVLMTALVASLGFVPMAIATGAGAEVQKPLATVVIGGILSSTFLTLLVLPALYRMWHREGHAATDTRDVHEAVLSGAGSES